MYAVKYTKTKIASNVIPQKELTFNFTTHFQFKYTNEMPRIAADPTINNVSTTSDIILNKALLRDDCHLRRPTICSQPFPDLYKVKSPAYFNNLTLILNQRQRTKNKTTASIQIDNQIK